MVPKTIPNGTLERRAPVEGGSPGPFGNTPWAEMSSEAAQDTPRGPLELPNRPNWNPKGLKLTPREPQHGPKLAPTSPETRPAKGNPRGSSSELGPAECAKRLNPAPEGQDVEELWSDNFVLKLRPQIVSILSSILSNI